MDGSFSLTCFPWKKISFSLERWMLMKNILGEIKESHEFETLEFQKDMVIQTNDMKVVKASHSIRD